SLARRIRAAGCHPQAGRAGPVPSLRRRGSMQTDPSVRDRRRPPHLFRWLTSGRSLWLAALFSALPTLSWAQTEVSGRVIDAQTSAPLAGAQVTVQGTNVGTVTNASGDYSLTMP